MRYTTPFLHCLSSLRLCRLSLFGKPRFYTWQVAEIQQPGDMQLSIIFLLMANIRWLSAIQSPALRFTGYLLIPCPFLLGLIPWMWLEWFAGAGPRELHNPVLHELLLQHFYPCHTGLCGCRTSPQPSLSLLLNSVSFLADWTTTMYNFCILLIVILIFQKIVLYWFYGMFWGCTSSVMAALIFSLFFFSPFTHFYILPSWL